MNSEKKKWYWKKDKLRRYVPYKKQPSTTKIQVQGKQIDSQEKEWYIELLTHNTNNLKTKENVKHKWTLYIKNINHKLNNYIHSYKS